jgi:hypothetical protein
MLALGIAAVLLASSPSLRAQAGARERTLFVSAVDADGNPVEILQPEDVIVREDGVRREVLRVSRASEPIDVALLVDNSAASRDLLVPLRDGLKRFVDTMTRTAGAPPVQIAIIGLAARPTILSDYTSDPMRLTDAIGRIFPDSVSGMTLLDAVTEVSSGLERRETPRAYVVPVITDGADFSNRYYKQALEALSDAGAGFHVITVGTFPVSNDDPTRNREFFLGEAVRMTGGQRISLLSASAVSAALESLGRELATQYKVVYSRPESLIPPEKTDVAASRPGVTVFGTPARGQRTGG